MDNGQQAKQYIRRRQNNEKGGCVLTAFLAMTAFLALSFLSTRHSPLYFQGNDTLHLLIFFGFLFVLGLFCFLSIIIISNYADKTEEYKQDWLNHYGKTIEATITQHIKVERNRGRPSYDIKLEWQNQNKQEYAFRQRVGDKEQDLHPFKVNMTLPVQFDPDDPSFYIVQYKRVQRQSL